MLAVDFPGKSYPLLEYMPERLSQLMIGRPLRMHTIDPEMEACQSRYWHSALN